MLTLVAWAAEVAHESESAAAGLASIGLDWKALLFQIVNFAILLWLLKRFAYRPVTKILEARRQKIEESLRNADAIAGQMQALEAERTRRVSEAEQEASGILAQSKQESSRLLQSAQAKGRQQAESLRAEALANIEQERSRMQQAVKAQTLQLVRRASERLLREKLDSEADAKLIARALNEVQS